MPGAENIANENMIDAVVDIVGMVDEITEDINNGDDAMQRFCALAEQPNKQDQPQEPYVPLSDSDRQFYVQHLLVCNCILYNI